MLQKINYQTFTRMNKKSLTLVQAAAIGALLLAACGTSSASNSTGGSGAGSAGGGSSGSASSSTSVNSPLKQVQLVSQVTSGVKTMHLNFTSVGTMTMPTGQSVTATFTGDGDEDIANGLASFTMQENMSLPGSQPMSFQAIIDNGTDYLSSSLMAGVPGVNKPWLSSNISQESGSNAITGVLTDPTKMLSLLSSVGTVTNLGSTSVNGVSATEYGVSVDMSKVAQSGSNNVLVGVMRCLGTTTLPMNIWIDNQGRAVKVSFVWNLDLAAGTTSMRDVVNASYYFSKFGEPVSITPPAASDVQPLSSLSSATGSTPATSVSGACQNAS